MNVLVTGGAGFIGSNLVDRLIRDGHKVIVIDNLSTGKRVNLNPKVKFFELDICNYRIIKPKFKGIEVVFHVAALPTIRQAIENPEEAFRVNVTGTLNILLAAREAGIRRVIYSSSCSIYGRQNQLPLSEKMQPKPLNPYALFKYNGEELCRLFANFYKLDTISLRYFNVYGPRMNVEGDYASVIRKFLNQKSEGRPITIVGDGTQTRDFIFVTDVIKANILATRVKNASGEAINIGEGNSYSIKNLADIIGGECVYIAPRVGEVKYVASDINKAKQVLGWAPKVNLKKGISILLKEIN